MTTPLRFRVFGDSIAAGVGCTRAEQGLGHLLTEALCTAGHAVDLGVHAVSGARSADLAAQVRAVLPTGVDLALIIIGANDLTSFTPPVLGARLLHQAVADLRDAGAQVIVVTAPDLGVVPHVPPAYRDFVSQVSQFYAHAQADAVTRAGGTVADIGADLHSRFATDTTLFSPDHYHPSPRGYAVIADALTPHLRNAVRKRVA